MRKITTKFCKSSTNGERLQSKLQLLANQEWVNRHLSTNFVVLPQETNTKLTLKAQCGNLKINYYNFFHKSFVNSFYPDMYIYKVQTGYTKFYMNFWIYPNAQCGNFRTLLPLRFYVKSILKAKFAIFVPILM